jgi:hypothetical protein
MRWRTITLLDIFSALAGVHVQVNWIVSLPHRANTLFDQADMLLMPLCGPLLLLCWPRWSFLLPKMTRAKWSNSLPDTRRESLSTCFFLHHSIFLSLIFPSSSSPVVFPCNISARSRTYSELVDVSRAEVWHLLVNECICRYIFLLSWAYTT